jgi:hypothetical protein
MAAVQFGIQRQEGKGLVNGFTISMYLVQFICFENWTMSVMNMHLKYPNAGQQN